MISWEFQAIYRSIAVIVDNEYESWLNAKLFGWIKLLRGKFHQQLFTVCLLDRHWRSSGPLILNISSWFFHNWPECNLAIGDHLIPSSPRGLQRHFAFIKSVSWSTLLRWGLFFTSAKDLFLLIKNDILECKFCAMHRMPHLRSHAIFVGASRSRLELCTEIFINVLFSQACMST